MNFVLQKETNQKKKRITAAFFIVLIFADILMLWKSKFGGGGNDESFYLTIAHRLAKGDAMLSEEWHLSQMSGVFTYPFMKLYLLLFSSLDGVLLHFRWIFIGVKSLFAVVYFLLLKKSYGIYAVFCCAIYLLFTPFNILQMSYNTMGLSFLLLFGILWITIADAGKKRKFFGIFAGISLACAVLCCPYLAVLYGSIFLIKMVRFVWKKEKLGLVDFAYATLGCIITAVLFFIFVLSRTSVHSILENIPEMLKDPEHPMQSVWRSTLNLLKSIFQFYPVMTAGFFLIVICTAVSIFYSQKKGRRGKTTIFLEMILFCAVVQLFLLARNITFSYNLIMLVPCFGGLFVYYLVFFNGMWEKMPKQSVVLYSFGVLYGWLLNMSSNNQLNIFSSAMSIAAIASILAFCDYTRLVFQKEEKKIGGGYFSSYKSLFYVFP